MTSIKRKLDAAATARPSLGVRKPAAAAAAAAAPAAGAGAGPAPFSKRIKKEPVEPTAVELARPFPSLHGVPDEKNLCWEDDGPSAVGAAAAAAAASSTAVELPSYFTSESHAAAARTDGRTTRDALLKPDGTPPDTALAAVRNMEQLLLQIQPLEAMMRANEFVRSDTKPATDPVLLLVKKLGEVLLSMPRTAQQQQRFSTLAKSAPITAAAVRPAIKLYGVHHESQLLIECGRKRSRYNREKFITRPPCLNGRECEGMRGGIRGFFERSTDTPHERRMGSGMVLMMWMSEDELVRLESTGVQPELSEPRFCLLCLRATVSQFVDSMIHQHITAAGGDDESKPLPEVCVLQPLGNRENCPDGYLRSACMMPSASPFNGITQPVVRFLKEDYLAHYDEKLEARVLSQESIVFKPAEHASDFIRRAATEVMAGVSVPTKALAMASELARVQNFPK